MAKRDLRHKLVGRLVEGSGQLISRDVNRTLHCERCGGHLDMHTVPMTGQIVEECRGCGVRKPVSRFVPVAEDETERHR